ncbi:MAG: pyridoxamine 5'-phosphate oxidase family protein [Anaerolineaceae bacterium]|nr:pyridoxamine 5'-phosphate oxidase family protein [Anaerolineaceae bacterium]
MLTDSVREFLKKPLLARISTIDREGYPHTVPVWFDVDGDDIILISVRNTAKIDYIQANPKGAVTIGGDTGDGGGYLIKGTMTVEEDPGLRWLKQVTHRYESGEQAEKDIAEWSKLDMAIIRLKPTKVLKV